MSTIETERSRDQHLVDLIVAAMSPLFDRLDARLNAAFDAMDVKIAGTTEQNIDRQIMMENHRDLRIDMARERYSFMLNAANAGGSHYWGTKLSITGIRYNVPNNRPLSFF